jgi:hypothetical protein|uniref:Uncharacterized protein n=1 Tax=Siphoviridae sp. ctHEr2 TaxID=2826229 RepID=A0A8S5NEL9_9CAUD|nr:MAG TPA: hypothetical protein [Siphoviridae sp. ctHEr2]
MRIVLKKHTGVVVHWGKDDSLGDVCNALESLMDKGHLDSFKVRKGVKWPYTTETQIRLSTMGGTAGVLDQHRQILIDGDFVQTDWEIPDMITHECGAPLINWKGECKTVVARTYNSRDLSQLKALSRDWGDRIELDFRDGRVCLDGVSLLGEDIVVIGEKEPCTARVEIMPKRLDDEALAEKFGGDRVEIVNRGHWEA